MPSATTTTNGLEKEDHARDAAFAKALHGQTGQVRGGLTAMRGKDKAAQKAAVDEYFKHWDNKLAATETEETRKARRDEYATLTRHYYNLATDLYEYGWGQSFHFCRYAYREGFYQAIARHEHYLALQMGMRENMKVLDVGCGVGGPAREMIRFTGANVVGFNNNDYQLQRAAMYARKHGVEDKFLGIKGDFMQMPAEFAGTFDMVYAIEATVHAPRLQGVYEEIYKALKPGGIFGCYEWLMTDEYDNDNQEHREIRLGIEQGDGISNMVKVEEGLAAFKGAGFEMIHHEDLALRPDAIPWYYPLAGELKHVRSLGDLFTVGRMTYAGRTVIHKLLGVGEMVHLIPQGTQKTADSLALAADCLVAGGRKHLFTPMYLMVGRKPLN